jgi:glycosyltransferase involved in cell wall biosynthesis
LVAALADCRDLDWRLTIVGDPERDASAARALRAAIAAGGIGDRVRLAGEHPPARTEEAYRAADLFALASHHEGYGMAFAEAMAHGLPIVATEGGAVGEVVPAEAGLLVPPGDRAALATALALVIDDPARRAAMSAAARVQAERLPGWPETAGRFGEALLAFAGRPWRSRVLRGGPAAPIFD